MLQTRAAAANIAPLRWMATASAARPAAEESSSGKRQATHHHHSTELKMTRLPTNGLMVTTVDSGRAVSRLALVFRAGSRYETPDQRGMAHRIRNCFGLGTSQSTQIGLLWRAGIIGSNMGSILTRDYIMFQLDVLRDHASEGLAVLGEAGCQPAFKGWELEETEEAIRFETKQMKERGEKRCMELLHKAAYRNGPLGTPLFCSSKRAGSFKAEALADYVSQHLLSGEAAFVGLDVDHELVLSFAADSLDMKSGKGLPPTPSPYKGGEERKNTPGPLAHVMVAGEGSGLQDPKGLATLNVLAGVLGTGPHVKWSEGCGGGRVAQAVIKQVGGSPFHSTSFTAAHSDGGLFGVYSVATPDKIGEVVKAAMAPLKELAGGAVKEEELKRAKARARNEILFASENGDSVLEDVGSQTLANGSILNEEDLTQLVNNVTAKDIQAAAKKVLSKKLSLSAVGNTQSVPYTDEL